MCVTSSPSGLHCSSIDPNKSISVLQPTSPLLENSGKAESFPFFHSNLGVERKFYSGYFGGKALQHLDDEVSVVGKKKRGSLQEQCLNMAPL